MIVPLFLIPIAVGVFTQFLKKAFHQRLMTDIEVAGMPLPRYGGMPSAHTAFALSVVTLVYLVEGWNTPLFAVTVAGAIFILDDALRMRIFLGRHGLALTKLIAKLPEGERAKFPRLEKRLGHKPLEVLVGGIIGVVGTVLLYWMVR